MYDLLCPGCGHRTAMNIIDKIIADMNIKKNVIFAHDVACCSLLTDYVYYDGIMCPHGRVIPVSIGIKSARYENFVLSYMGDGAAYEIGFNELIHAASRKDDICAVVINNGILAMTGGQKTSTNLSYQNFKIENIFKSFNVSFMARAILSDKKNIDIAEEFLREEFNTYMTKGGFNIVELISPCPTNYKKSINECVDILNTVVKNRYGIFKETNS